MIKTNYFLFELFSKKRKYFISISAQLNNLVENKKHTLRIEVVDLIICDIFAKLLIKVEGNMNKL